MIERLYLKRREQKKIILKPIAKEIVLLGKSKLTKRILPKHFTKFNWVKFMRTHPSFIITLNQWGLEKNKFKAAFHTRNTYNIKTIL